jgi:hypothetical protein
MFSGFLSSDAERASKQKTTKSRLYMLLRNIEIDTKSKKKGCSVRVCDSSNDLFFKFSLPSISILLRIPRRGLCPQEPTVTGVTFCAVA